jgi:glycosyltransferase involved in cell wall biosynthesis
MNILLLNYNYYPYAWGGSEVYVHNWAKFLVSQGHSVTVLAAVPIKKQENIVFRDNTLQVCFYEYEGIKVLGASLFNETTEEIYSKYNPFWVQSWQQFFSQLLPHQNFAWLHYNGYTGLISTALAEGLHAAQRQLHLATAKVMTSYHTPISCPNGKLLYHQTTACSITPTVSTCASCVVNSVYHIPSFLGAVWAVLPAVSHQKLPTPFQMKHFVAQSLQSFHRLNAITQHWLVMSEEISQVIQRMGVDSQKISMVRHGIHPDFIPEKPINKPTNKIIFAYMGRFETIKGVHTLLQAWLGLSKNSHHLPVELLMIGELQSQNTVIQAWIDKAKRNESVRFLGNQKREQIIEILHEVHCVIIPSEWVEIGPLVLHEAIASGANIIASDIGGTKELANYYNEGCTTFAQGNVEDLQNKIRNFVYQPISPKVQTQTTHYKKIYQIITEKL